MKTDLIVILFFETIFVSVTISSAQLKFSGYMFGDYYYVVKNHNEKIEGENGFWFRRIYFTADNKLNDEFSVRYRMELNSTGNFQTKDKLTPYTKHAYIKWSRNNQSIVFGLSPTPTFELIENLWGYRSVEKPPMDLQGYRPTSNFGINFQGALDPKKTLNYSLMFANRGGTSSEVGKGKSIMLSLAVKNKGFVIEGYADTYDESKGKRTYVLQGFVGYESKQFRGGAQYSRQTRRIGPNAGNKNYGILSFFATGEFALNVWGIARSDKILDPNPGGASIAYLPLDPTAKMNIIILGLDLRPIKDVHIMPNVEIVKYDKPEMGNRPNSDFMPRLTLWYNF